MEAPQPPALAPQVSQKAPSRLRAFLLKPRSWAKFFATLALCGFLAFLLAFSWKVFSYYRGIQKGTLDPSTLSFAASTVSAAQLENVANTAPGSGALATDDDPSFGSPNAPVTIVAFADFGCPHSEEESFILQAMAQSFSDKIRIIYRDFPLPELHPGADIAAQAAGCAAEQDKYAPMYLQLYEHQEEFTQENVEELAIAAGLNRAKYRQCMQSDYYVNEVNQDLADGIAAGVKGTPTLFINGVKVEGAIPYGLLSQVVTAMVP